jgi:predicted GNAT family N-acyltransferase
MLPASQLTIHIRPAVTAADKHAVYAFRYAVIVDEMHIPIAAADHHRRLVIDPEDDTGHSLAAFRGDTVVGALRVNFLRDGGVEPHRTIFGFDRVPAARRAVSSVSTRFFVAASLRGTGVAIRITQAWFRFCRARGIEWDYILVKAHLVGFYRRHGWKQLSEPVQHVEVGEVVPLVLHLTDEAHLRALESPFVECLADLAHA